MSNNTDMMDDPEVARSLANSFALLLKGHAELARRAEGRSTSPLTGQFSRLLADFTEAHRKSDAEDRARSTQDRDRLTRMLRLFGDARERNRRGQEEVADDFNLLEVLQLTGKEIRHSMVLTWLLGRDLERHGTHAQGPLGFRLFLREFGLPREYADVPYWVRREVAGDESIVDIEVAARGRFLIHVENKIWSAEGIDQTDREWADLRRRAVSLGIDPSAPDAPVHALFLTPRGVKPVNPHFTPISWQQIIRVLEAFAKQAKPMDVKLFAAHYARAIRTFVIRQGREHEEKDDGQAATE